MPKGGGFQSSCAGLSQSQGFLGDSLGRKGAEESCSPSGTWPAFCGQGQERGEEQAKGEFDLVGENRDFLWETAALVGLAVDSYSALRNPSEISVWGRL